MLAVYAADFALSMALVAAAFIDAEHMYLPDSITLGGTVLGFATATLRGPVLARVARRRRGGFVGVWLPFIVIYKRIRGRRRNGARRREADHARRGVVRLARNRVRALRRRRARDARRARHPPRRRGRSKSPKRSCRDREELQRAAAQGDEEAIRALEEDPLAVPRRKGIGQSRLPFGPFLILAILEFLLAGDQIVSWYERFLVQIGHSGVDGAPRFSIGTYERKVGPV